MGGDGGGQLSESPKADRSADLALLSREIEDVCAKLRAAERRITLIPDLKESDADAARQALADARWAFDQMRLRLLDELEDLAVHDPKAAAVRQAISERQRYASAASAETIARLVETLHPRLRPERPASAGALAEQLDEAIRRRRDNKKSAAHDIGVSTRTLNQMLRGESTKQFSQDKAWRYIREVFDSS